MRGLRFHLFWQLFLPLAVLASLLVWMTFSMVERLVESRLENEIELVARTISRPVQEALNAGALDRMGAFMTSVFEIGGVYGAYVYDSEGRRVASAGEVVPGRRQQLQAAELVAAGEQRGQYEAVAGEEVYSYFVPLTGPGGRIKGLLQLTRAESEIAVQLNRIRVWGWLLLGGVLGIMLLILFLGHRRAVGRHVDRLMASMARIETGERSHRAEVRGPRELAALAAGLNRMLDGLARMERELADQRREQVRMAERLRDQEKYAALGRFSSGVAHELGAPLSVIDGDARRLDGEVEPVAAEVRQPVGGDQLHVDIGAFAERPDEDAEDDDDPGPRGSHRSCSCPKLNRRRAGVQPRRPIPARPPAALASRGLSSFRIHWQTTADHPAPGKGKAFALHRVFRFMHSPRPNFVFIFADQLSARHCGPYGNEHVRTPTMNRMAERGVGVPVRAAHGDRSVLQDDERGEEPGAGRPPGRVRRGGTRRRLRRYRFRGP